MPLGVGLDLRAEDGELTLAEGDLLLLYTDGLVEKRTQQLGEGLDRLLEVARTAPADPDAFVDHLLAAMVPEERRPDDVAVLALGPTPRAAETTGMEGEPVASLV